MVAGVLAQWAPAPLVLCYLVGLVVAVVVGLAVVRVPEPHPGGGTWRPQLPSVPAGRRVEFARAGVTGAASWSIGSLFLSVVPSYASTLLHTHDLALLGAVSSIMLGCASAAQAVCQRTHTAAAVAQGSGLLFVVGGLAALVGAFPARSLAVLLVAAVLGGVGLGLGTIGAQTEVNGLAPPERRGEVTAAYLACIYTGVIAALIGTGLLSQVVSLFAAVTLVSIAIAVVAVTFSSWHWVARSRAHQRERELACVGTGG